jgi:hypothetical protein
MITLEVCKMKTAEGGQRSIGMEVNDIIDELVMFFFFDIWFLALYCLCFRERVCV